MLSRNWQGFHERPLLRSTVSMMAKAGKDAIEMDGIVTDALPNAMFRVELEANKQVLFESAFSFVETNRGGTAGYLGPYLGENSKELHQNPSRR